jgi:hypothetical protein
MAKCRWTLTLEGRTYQILYRHRCFSQHELWQDGVLIKKTTRQISEEFHFYWEIKGHQCEVMTLPSNGFLNILLRVDNDPINCGEKTLPKKVENFLVEETAWKNLGESLGLEYRPRQNRSGIELFRLIGDFCEHLALVSFGLFVQEKIIGSGIYTIIRHGYLNSSMILQAKKQFESHSSLKEAGEKGFLEIGSTKSSLFTPLKGKFSIQGHEEEVRNFLILAEKYLPAFPDKCEGEQCAASSYETLKTVFVNDTPFLFCDQCISSIESMAKSEYEKITKFGGWGKGLVSSIWIAFVATITMGLAMYYFPPACIVLGLFAFIFISKPIYRKSNKPSHVKFFTILGLSTISLLIGLYLGILADLIWTSNHAFSLGTLLQALIAFKTNEYLSSTMIIFLELIYIYFGLMNWRGSKRTKEQFLHPEIEVLDFDYMK